MKWGGSEEEQKRARKRRGKKRVIRVEGGGEAGLRQRMGPEPEVSKGV